MDKNPIISRLKEILSRHGEIAFAYVHGSVLSSASPRDLDIAVYLYPDIYKRLADMAETNIGFGIPLEMEMQKALGMKVDTQVLNAAPLSFRHRVVQQGFIVLENDPGIRYEFEYRARYQYFDFRPKRKEYLREALT